jgi:Mn2+/Fe2+ NRAMP family transporter
LFAIGLLGASALAAAVVPLSTAYAIGEAIGTESSVSRSFGEARLFLGLFTFQILFGACFALVPGNLISLLVNAQILNGVITPILLGFILVLANRSSVLGAAANGRVFRAVATVAVALIGVMAVGAIFATFA